MSVEVIRTAGTRAFPNQTFPDQTFPPPPDLPSFGRRRRTQGVLGPQLPVQQGIRVQAVGELRRLRTTGGERILDGRERHSRRVSLTREHADETSKHRMGL